MQHDPEFFHEKIIYGNVQNKQFPAQSILKNMTKKKVQQDRLRTAKSDKHR